MNALGCTNVILLHSNHQQHDKWAPVTMAWWNRRLRMEERSLVWRVAVNILNKELQTDNKGWSTSLGVGQGANNSSP